MATVQKDSTRMPPTMATDFEPPIASRMIPMAVIKTAGTSAVKVKVRRARFKNLVVGLRRRKPHYSGRHLAQTPGPGQEKQNTVAATLVFEAQFRRSRTSGSRRLLLRSLVRGRQQAWFDRWFEVRDG